MARPKPMGPPKQIRPADFKFWGMEPDPEPVIPEPEPETDLLAQPPRCPNCTEE